MADELHYLKAMDRLSKALQTRALDQHIINQFNEAYEEAEKLEEFISDIEIQTIAINARKRYILELLGSSYKLRQGVIRNIKQLRRHKGWKAALIKTPRHA